MSPVSDCVKGKLSHICVIGKDCAGDSESSVIPNSGMENRGLVCVSINSELGLSSNEWECRVCLLRCGTSAKLSVTGNDKCEGWTSDKI